MRGPHVRFCERRDGAIHRAYSTRDFTTAEMALMRSLIAASPQQTRAGLAREFCHAINWVGPDDRIRAMMARLTMLAMHRDGIITLPPPRQAPRRLRKPEPCRETDPPQAPVPETLEAVRPIRLVCITGADRKASRVWNGFVARWHYLGYTPLIGAQMRYAAEDREGRTLALLGFSAAAWKTAPRDAFIGWSPQVREKNLQYVIDNSRYLILPWVRIPNLASHILSEAQDFPMLDSVPSTTGTLAVFSQQTLFWRIVRRDIKPHIVEMRRQPS